MSAPTIPHELQSKDVGWLKRDVLLFAVSIGCTVDELHFLYELHPKFAVFPTYPTILPFKLTDEEITDYFARQSLPTLPGMPKFDSKRGVDGQRKLTIFKSLPTSSTGKSFELRSRVIGIYDKGKAGTVIETEQCIVDKRTGEIYSRAVGSAFLIGQGNWGGPKGPISPAYPHPTDRMPDAIFEIHTSNETAYLYRLNGDYNPLHAGPDLGQKMGFGGAILHGLYSWNTVAHGILKQAGFSNPRAPGVLSAIRFSSQAGRHTDHKVMGSLDRGTRLRGCSICHDEPNGHTCVEQRPRSSSASFCPIVTDAVTFAL
ncbi:MaoC like domain-containing protein [Cladophialophora immunda]|nr:MaoC like domain-containing protein [Cladophialophora immunda]